MLCMEAEDGWLGVPSTLAGRGDLLTSCASRKFFVVSVALRERGRERCIPWPGLPVVHARKGVIRPGRPSRKIGSWNLPEERAWKAIKKPGMESRIQAHCGPLPDEATGQGWIGATSTEPESSENKHQQFRCVAIGIRSVALTRLCEVGSGKEHPCQLH